jgi:peptide chain release factor subunit 3
MMGFMLCTPSAPIKTVKAFEVQLVILEHKNIICAGYNAIMHIHAAIEEVVITVSVRLIP